MTPTAGALARTMLDDDRELRRHRTRATADLMLASYAREMARRLADLDEAHACIEVAVAAYRSVRWRALLHVARYERACRLAARVHDTGRPNA